MRRAEGGKVPAKRQGKASVRDKSETRMSKMRRTATQGCFSASGCGAAREAVETSYYKSGMQCTRTVTR